MAQKLSLQWSPKQISGWLKRQFPADQGMQVSHEAIYRSLFIQTRGVLTKQLMAHLRTARQMRQAKGGTTKKRTRTDRRYGSIRERTTRRVSACERNLTIEHHDGLAGTINLRYDAADFRRPPWLICWAEAGHMINNERDSKTIRFMYSSALRALHLRGTRHHSLEAVWQRPLRWCDRAARL